MQLTAPRRRSGLFGLDDGNTLPAAAGAPSDPTSIVLPTNGTPATWSQMLANNQAAVDAQAAAIAAKGGDRDPSAAGGAEAWAPIGHGDNAGVDYSTPTVIRATDPTNPPKEGYYQVATQGPGDSIKYTTLKQTTGIDPALMVFAAVVTMGAAASMAAAGAAADTSLAAGTTTAEGGTTAAEGSSLATDEFANETAKLAVQSAADAGSLGQVSTSLSSIDLGSSTALDASASLTGSSGDEFANETAKLAAQNVAEPGSLGQVSTNLSSIDLSGSTLQTDGVDQLQNETNKLMTQNAAEPGTLPQVQTNLPSLDLNSSTNLKDAYDQAKGFKKIYDTTKMVLGILTGGKTAQVAHRQPSQNATHKGSLTPWIQPGAALVRQKSGNAAVTPIARHSFWQGGGGGGGNTGGPPPSTGGGSNRGVMIGLAVLGAFLLLGS